MNSNPAVEDFATIRRRQVEIEVAADPKCPRQASRRLYDCLRSATRCPSDCDNYGNWIGPQK